MKILTFKNGKLKMFKVKEKSVKQHNPFSALKKAQAKIATELKQMTALSVMASNRNDKAFLDAMREAYAAADNSTEHLVKLETAVNEAYEKASVSA